MSLPRYTKEYIQEWRQYDPKLRLRRSIDEYGMYLLERKTRYIFNPPFRPSSADRCVQLNDDYRKVLAFWPNEIHLVRDFLRRYDIQRLGGAKELGQKLDADETRLQELMERKHKADLEAASGEAYERLAWMEQRRISMSGAHRV